MLIQPNSSAPNTSNPQSLAGSDVQEPAPATKAVVKRSSARTRNSAHPYATRTKTVTTQSADADKSPVSEDDDLEEAYDYEKDYKTPPTLRDVDMDAFPVSEDESYVAPSVSKLLKRLSVHSPALVL